MNECHFCHEPFYEEDEVCPTCDAPLDDFYEEEYDGESYFDDEY